MAGAHRPRSICDWPDRSDPRRRGRSRFDRRTARPRGRSLGDRYRPGHDRDTVLGLGAHASWTWRPTSWKAPAKSMWLRRDRRRDPRPFRCAGARRRHRSSPSSGNPRSSPSDGRADLLRRRAGPLPTSGPRPTPQGRTAEADRRSGTAARRSARCVRPEHRTPGKTIIRVIED